MTRNAYLALDIRQPCALSRQIVGGLQVHPEFGGVPEVQRKTKGRIGCDRTLSFCDLIDAAGRNAEVDRQLVFCDSKRDEKFIGEDFTGVNRREFGHVFGSVIIDDLYSVRMAAAPFKTDAPLVVNTDRILSCAVARQLLKAICRRNFQVVQRNGSFEDSQLPLGDPFEIDEAANPHPARQFFRVAAPERLDQKTIV